MPAFLQDRDILLGTEVEGQDGVEGIVRDCLGRVCVGHGEEAILETGGLAE